MAGIAETVTRFRLALENAQREQELQRFLERHPWAIVLSGISPPVVVSQLPLGSDYRCDFAYVARGSTGFPYWVLTEIESPKLNVFTANDEFTAEFNHAVQQLEDWHSWCRTHPETLSGCIKALAETRFSHQDPDFRSLVMDSSSHLARWRDYLVASMAIPRVSLVLIAGRRSQLDNSRRKRRWEERVNSLPRHARVRTWDGLLELQIQMFKPLSEANPDYSPPVVCVRYRNQGFELIAE